MKKQLLTALGLVVLLLFGSAQMAFAQLSISGTNPVCAGKCYTYTVSGGNTNPYTWTITGGTPSAATGSTANICWGAAGAANISVAQVGSATASLTVTINPKPAPVIIKPPLPNCNLAGNNSGSPAGNDAPPDPCIDACAFATHTYYTQYNTGSTYVWSVGRASDVITFINPNGNQINVLWGAVGNSMVKVVETNQFGCVDSTQLCVHVIASPVASFNTLPATIAGTVTICQGQPVSFLNTSTGYNWAQWNFGDASPLLTTTNPIVNHPYTTPGTYTATLIVRNSCYCTDTTSVQVVVQPGASPDIECVSTVCPADTACYYTNHICSTYNWSVTGQTNWGNFAPDSIWVVWGNGPIGTVTLSTPCSTCPIPTTVQVPIISPTVPILGPTLVCYGATQNYSLPIAFCGGTEYTWTVTGGTIVAGQGTSDITIQWDDWWQMTTNGTINVTYNNCYLGCGGSGNLNVLIRPELAITGPDEACQNTLSTFTAGGLPSGFPLGVCNWFVLTPANVQLPAAFNTPTLPYVWSSGPGTYIVKATSVIPNAFCNDTAYFTVVVAPAPPVPTGIAGPTFVCPGGSYTYTALASPPAGTFNWAAVNGTLSANTGNTVTVTWNPSGPYSLSVTQTMINSPFCTSLPFTLAVTGLTAPTITGPSPSCENATVTYSVPFIAGENYTWNISPSTSGSIISGSGANSISVQWNVSGAAVVSVSVCGFTANQIVTINPKFPVTVSGPANLCAGSSALLSVVGGYCAPYVWQNASGATISTGATATITQGGSYFVSVTDCVTGCTGVGSINVTGCPLPDAAITSPGVTVTCAGASGTLYALNNAAGYTYQWYNGATPIGGATSPSYSISGFGSYTVVVTNSCGCTAQSNVITAGAPCGCSGQPPCPPGSCTPGGSAAFITTSGSNCNFFNFDASPSVNASAYSWSFGDGNVGSGVNVNHTYTQPGYYQVILSATVPNLNPPPATCVVTRVETILVPMVANFTVGAGCNPLCFTDASTFVPTTSLTGWSWNFGDPASGINNTSTLQNPCHQFSTSGSYTVTLTVTSSAGCTSQMVKNITVQAPPVPSITTNAPACQADGVTFGGSSTNTIVNWLWNFGDPPSGIANTSTYPNTSHTYNLPGAYTVTLTVTDTYGCTGSAQQNITIYPNTMTGLISVAPAPPQCEGTPLTLTAPGGAANYQWNTGATTQPITVTTNGTYSVTMFDVNGCQYIPPAQTIAFNPNPTFQIKGPTEVCECSVAQLKVLPCNNTNFTYQWSNGFNSCNIYVNPPWFACQTPPGTHTYTVTVTDNTTGCTSSAAHTIVVHPLPAPFTITSSPAGTHCAGDTVTFTAPVQSGIFYAWSTGQVGVNSITTVVQEGGYFALAIDSVTGCERKSNVIQVNPIPDICVVPSGCYKRCGPDTICVPNIYAAYQWYLNGNPIAPPAGTSNNYVATQSGTYQVLLTNSFGCTALSNPLYLTLIDCSPCASVQNDTILCDLQNPGYYLYNFQVFNNTGFTVNQISLFNLSTSGNGGVFVAPNVFGVTLPNQATTPMLTAGIGGPGAQPGDTICFQLNLHEMSPTGNEIQCCATDTICIVLPDCGGCECNMPEFIANVNAGFAVIPIDTCKEYAFVANSLGVCDSIQWIIDNTYLYYGNGNDTITHIFTASGIHTICMVATQYDANGNICGIYEKCLEINVPPCCQCDEAFYAQANLGFFFSISGYNGTFTPYGSFDPNCDQVTWSVQTGTGSTVFATTQGSNPAVYTFPTHGNYCVCMTVKRYSPSGQLLCQYTVCRKVKVPKIIIGPDDPTTDPTLLITAFNIVVVNPTPFLCITPLPTYTVNITLQPAHGTVVYSSTTGEFIYTPDPGFSGTDVFVYYVCTEGTPGSCDMVIASITVSAGAFIPIQMQATLEGAYNTATTLMNTTLRQNNLLPITQPYSATPWQYGGAEGYHSSAAIPDNAVDYVLIEARSAATPNVVVETRAGLLANNGIINGYYPDNIVWGSAQPRMKFYNLEAGQSYYFVLRHRNHLAVMTALPVSVPFGGVVNFVHPAQVMGGASQLKLLPNGSYALLAADFNADGVMSVADFNLFITQSGAVNQYRRADANMDGNVTITDFNLFMPNASRIGVPFIRY